MADKIKLVQGDTRPQIQVTLTDESTGSPIDISGATPRLKFRAAGEETILDTLVGTVQNGPNGVAIFIFNPTTLDVEPGDYEGEIEVTFSDGGVQTAFELQKFKVRAQF